MKIFRSFPTGNEAGAPFGTGTPVASIPDTALLVQKRPFFIPDFTRRCTLTLCLCVRINRLGRSIHRQFAHRYYNAAECLLAVHFTAADLLETLQQASAPWDLAIGFDNAVSVSRPFSPAADVLDIELQVGEQSLAYQANLPKLLASADAMIESLSEYYTMRQGDLLLLPLPVNGVQVQIDDRLTLRADKAEVLAFNIK